MANSDDVISEDHVTGPAGTPAGTAQPGTGLPQSADLFRTLFLGHPDGVALVVKGRIALVNRRFAEMSGYSTQEAIGMAPSELVVPEDKERLHDRIQDLHEQGVVYPSTYTLLCKDGSRLPIDAHSNPVQHDGETALISVLRDISDQKQAEKALLRSEERFRLSLMNTPIVVFEQDMELRYTWAHNPVPGFTLEDVLGKTDADLLPPEEAVRLTELKQQVLRSGEGTREVVEATIDGRRGYHDITIEPLLDEAGAIIGITAASFDITERKRAEEALRALERERYRRLLEVAPDGIVIVDGAGVIETVNVRTEELFGYDRKELIGSPVEMLIPERYHERHLALRQAYTASPSARAMRPEMDLHGLHKDGSEFPIDISLNALQTGVGISIIASIHDVTERVEAQESLRESETTNRALLAAMPDMIFRMGRDGTYLGFVPGAAADPAIQPSEFLGRNVREVLPDTADDAIRAIERALDSQETQTLNYELAYDDDMRSFEARVNASGEDDALVIVRDITARKRAEASLRESEARFSTAFHDNPVPAAISRMRDGKILDLNDAFLSMTGLRRAETTGRTAEELGVPLGSGLREEIAARVRESGTYRDLPVQIEKKTGEILETLSTLTLIDVEGESCSLITIIDVTEQKRLEHELQEMRDDLESKVERRMAGDNPYRLTFREFTVLHLIADGKADKEIAAELGISIYTVHRHVSNVLAKMDSPSRTEAGTRALREGLLE